MSDVDILDWSDEFLLRWSDFKAEYNPAAIEDSHSVIKYRYTWTVNSDKVGDSIVFFIENIQLFTEFYPLLSWVRLPQATDDLLTHEQGHFDLAELIKHENLEELKNSFYQKRFFTRGKNEEQRKQFAKEDSGKMIAKKVEVLEQLLEKKRRKYSEKTSFGQNKEKQSEYNLKFRELR